MKKTFVLGITLIGMTMMATAAQAYSELSCKDIYRKNATALVISKDKVSGYNLKILGQKLRGATSEGKLGFVDGGGNLMAETTVKAFTDHQEGQEYLVRTDFEGYTHLQCVVTKTDLRDR
jgi:hypothetical protein